MSPALLILSIESLGACMREEQKRITFSFLKKKSFLQVLMCWIIVTRRFHLCFWGSVTDDIRPQRRNLQYDYMCWQDGGDKNSIKGPAIIQRCQFYTVTAFKIASVTQHCFLHLKGTRGAVSLGRPFSRWVTGKRRQAHEISVTYVSSCLGCSALTPVSLLKDW